MTYPNQSAWYKPQPDSLRGRRDSRNRLQVAFRGLPKAQRKELTASFKAERLSDPKVDWTEWLEQQPALGSTGLRYVRYVPYRRGR